MRTNLRIFVSILLLCFCCGLSAQTFDKEHTIVGGYLRNSHMLNGLDIYDRLIESHDCATAGVTVGLHTLPGDNEYYGWAYNYPQYGFGFQYSNMSGIKCQPGSGLGDVYTLYGYTQIDFVKTRYFSFGPNLELGASYLTRKWDAVNNPKNLFVGTKVLVFLGMGVEASFHITPQWEMGMDVMLSHRSNGMLKVPNYGLNELGASVFLKYSINDRYLGRRGPRPELPDLKNWIFDIYFTGGVHSCDPERHVYEDAIAASGEENKWSQSKSWTRLNIGGTVAYRYHPMFSTGVGLDVFYTGNWKKLAECYEQKYGETVKTSPIYVGAYIQQSIYYKNFEVGIGLGVYLYKKLAIEDSTWNYQRTLLRYHIPKAGDIFFGIAMRAHQFDRSDTIEFCFGKRF